MRIVKETKGLGVLTFQEVGYNTAKEMIMKNHYSKKWNAAFGTFNVGVYKEGVLKGVAVYGNLMNTKSYGNISNHGAGSVIELNRLWIDDELGHNAETLLISSSIKILKKVRPEVKYIQSFADGRLGCGTIYKAANFDYYGYTKSLFFKDDLTGEVFHKVPLENTEEMTGMMAKNALYLSGRLTAFYVKTYRYIYNLDKKDKAKLKSIPYPKYEKGQEWIENYMHPPGLLARLYVMYDFIGDVYNAKKAKMQLVSLGYDEMEIKILFDRQSKNKTFLRLKEERFNTQKSKELARLKIEGILEEVDEVDDVDQTDIFEFM